ncbi:hypothetical protein C8R45DRAFT_840549, partial [Mycena sanguinolenta]
YYTVDNAVNWLDIDKFMGWLSRSIQNATVSVPSTPMPAAMPVPPAPFNSSPPNASSMYSSPIHASSATHSGPRSTPVDHRQASRLASLTPRTSRDASMEILESESDGIFPATLSYNKRQRSISISSDSDSDSATKTKRKKKKSKRRSEDSVAISKQLSVPELRNLTEPQSCYAVPRPEEGDYAYLLDMTQDDREWNDKQSQPLSMITIIKSEDQDAWGGGTGGSTASHKATKVPALDNALCQVASHVCQGVFVCSEFDCSLLADHERYEPDDEAMRNLWEADRAVNVRDTSSSSIRAAAFYTEVHSDKKKCPFIRPDGTPCGGKPVYRPLRETNFDGKNGFIGCQNYAPGQKHRFVTINRDVDEEHLRDLFQNNGRFTTFVNVVSANCARVLPPRQGGKGDRKCPYAHVDAYGNVIQGKIIRRACTATIKIFAPIDRTNRRAIIYLSGPHNHPRPPCTKLSRKGKDAYQTAILGAGTTALTVLKCDNGSSTSEIFGGNLPGNLDPALANPRIKRKLIYDLTTVDNPNGLGWEGVCFFQQKMQATLPPEKRYIQYLISEDGIQLVLTMLPYLAGRIHFCKASLHDNTYARVHGTWKEWEVVIWDDKFDARATIARAYSQNETFAVFKKMWSALFATIERVTGTELKFKFIHGEGLRTVLVDGNKQQANALGVELVARNKPHLSGIHEFEPKKILMYCLRTCTIHIQRKFSELAKVVPDEDMGRIRRCLFLKTAEELADFIQWCRNSEYKIHTGTNLALLTAIQTAYKLDLETEAKFKLMEDNCVLINHNNSKVKRDRRNATRRATHHRQALERNSAQSELEEIQLALEHEAEARKTSNALTKELQAKN